MVDRDRPRRWHRATSWEQLGSIELPDGSRVSSLRIGEQDDPEAPVVLRVTFPAGGTLAAHSHDTDYVELILEGSQIVGRRTFVAGDVRIVKAGTAYGPLQAGPKGATVLVVFRDGRWRGRASRSSQEEEDRRDLLEAHVGAALLRTSPPG